MHPPSGSDGVEHVLRAEMGPAARGKDLIPPPPPHRLPTPALSPKEHHDRNPYNFPSYLECHLRRRPTPHGDDRGQFLLPVPWPGAPTTTVLCLSSISVPGRFRVVW
jgi:hypothetical protein